MSRKLDLDSNHDVTEYAPPLLISSHCLANLFSIEHRARKLGREIKTGLQRRTLTIFEPQGVDKKQHQLLLETSKLVGKETELWTPKPSVVCISISSCQSNNITNTRPNHRQVGVGTRVFKWAIFDARGARSFWLFPLRSSSTRAKTL